MSNHGGVTPARVHSDTTPFTLCGEMATDDDAARDESHAPDRGPGEDDPDRGPGGGSVKVALFVPCYVDQLRPEIGIAALDLLDQQGIAAEVPDAPVCCGQPLLTAGAPARARRLCEDFVAAFESYDHVVTPSGSCAATLRRHLAHLVPGDAARVVGASVHELCEFLVEVVGVTRIAGHLPCRVALHPSCHALRELRLGTPSESRAPGTRDPARTLLEGLDGLEIVPLRRADECCGFGGIFAVEEEAVSCRMGRDRLADHRAAGAEIVTSTDISCLLHLDGLARRDALPLRVFHVAELLMQRRTP